MKIRVLVVDDHPLFREGVAAVVNLEPDMETVAGAGSGAEGIAHHRRLRPEVTLMDLRLPDVSGIEAIRTIRAEAKEARIIVLSNFDGDAPIQAALEAGAQAYLVKSTPAAEVVAVIRRVAAGRKAIPAELAVKLAEYLSEEPLTPREVEVLEQVVKGYRYREIGERLFLSEETVKRHMKNVIRKLRARDRTQAVTIAARRGLIAL